MLEIKNSLKNQYYFIHLPQESESDRRTSDEEEPDDDEGEDHPSDEDGRFTLNLSDSNDSNHSGNTSDSSTLEEPSDKKRKQKHSSGRPAVTKGRRSNEALKRDALMMPFYDVASSMAVPCNVTCCLEKRCCSQLKMETVLKERLEFFNPVSEAGSNILILLL